MIKMIAMGVWGCLVALGTLMLSVKVNAVNPDISEASAPVVEEVSSGQTEVISVPILVEGVVQGYIISQLTYLIDKKVEKDVSLPLSVLINDAIFKCFWDSYSDVRAVEKIKFETVKKQIIDEVNQHFPTPVVKDLLVKQFNYLPADQIRDMKHTG
ncbi:MULTISPECIES: hypothetical protein [Bartonella]|uniref:Uncharacterized protein n=2 Tax=Bartonella TaxID=773 RepID=N6VHL6_9HYPH|nr:MULTISPECIES: hypothetical protein [Bartonella]ENN90552.1 hypothetical protein m07a_11590 [Bartonella schoenbuchensis m07a]MBA9083347.1 hypothetical protein [Bartonella chomelii]